MKKIAFVLAALMMGGIVVSAQKLKVSEVPKKVVASFTKKHPGMAAKWEKEDGQYEVGYKENGNEMTEMYSADGTMMESEIAIKATELPAAVLAYVKAHYKGADIKEAAKITKANGEINYEAEVKKMDVVFDASGKFIKEVKD